MSVCVGRQPILDRSHRTYAYELLYRSGAGPGLDGADPDQATLKVIDTSFFVLGIETLTGGRRAFVNFTRETLVNGYAASLPPERLVVEVLEDVAPDDEVIRACRLLKASGFHIALDDVVTQDMPTVLLDLADIVKVDFLQTDGGMRRRIARAFRPRGLRLLAEKVETEEEVTRALADGYELFQGFFFSRPALVSGTEVPAVKQNILRLLQEAQRPEPDHRRVEAIIRHDVALAFKLLKHMRTAAWGFQQPVESIQQALLLLGDRGLRKWAAIVAVATLGHDRPPELVVTSLVRAAFCEGLMVDLGQAPLAEEGFFLGLFSTIDAFLGLPLAEALDRVPLAEAVKSALVGEKGVLRQTLDVVLAYERADWPEVARLGEKLGVAEETLAERARQAMEHGNAVALPSPSGR